MIVNPADSCSKAHGPLTRMAALHSRVPRGGSLICSKTAHTENVSAAVFSFTQSFSPSTITACTPRLVAKSSGEGDSRSGHAGGHCRSPEMKSVTFETIRGIRYHRDLRKYWPLMPDTRSVYTKVYFMTYMNIYYPNTGGTFQPISEHGHYWLPSSYFL